MKATTAIAGGIITLVGAGAAWFFSTISVNPNPNAVTSTPGVRAAQYSRAIDTGRRLARDMILADNLPGLSVAVGVGGNIVWSEGVGWADLEAHRPVTPDTRFRIGTASTVLTSAAAGVLLQQGRLKLEDEIQTYVPDFPKKAWPVTLQQVMGHVAGISTDSGDEGPLFRQRCERPVEALEVFADQELLFEPGTQYRFSKYGWILVSAAVEAAAKQPFLTFMREQIFQPIGMGATGAESSTEENPEHIGEPSEDFPLFTLVHELILQPAGIGGATRKSAVPNIAEFYFPRLSADPRYGLHEMRPHNLSCYAGSMAFFSTPSDLVRFGLAMMSGKVLQPATVQSLQASQQLKSGEKTGYGLGWDLERVTLAGQPTQAAGHDGDSLGGMVASLMTFPDRGLVVAVTSNISYAKTSALAVKIADAFAQQGISVVSHGHVEQHLE
jgi:serine beta-lactamase-like protein LACTB, mitochondrial